MGLIDVAIARSMSELDSHQAAWNRLSETSPQYAPMLSYPWIATYLEHRLLPDESWLCVFVYDGDELVGVLPLIESPRSRGPMSYRVLRTPHDLHTISVGPLVAAGRSHEVIAHLLTSAQRACPSHFHIEMQRLPSSSPLWSPLESPLHRILWQRRYRGVGAYLPVPADFGEFRAGLSRNFRNNLNKAGNKLRKRSDIQFHFMTGADASAAELPRFAAVEAASWKGNEGTAIQGSPDLMQFYRALTTRLAQAGWLEWHILEAEGTTLAANLAIRLGHVLLLWKLGYDEAHRRLSPGSLLMERLIERAVADDGLDEINLMTDQPWYDNWQMQKRTCYDLTIYPWRALPMVFGYGASRARERMRDSPTAERAIARIKALRAGS